MNDYHQKFDESFPDYPKYARGGILAFIDEVAKEQFELGKNYSNSKRPGYHGMGKHPIYATWSTTLQRCRDPKNSNYRHYAGISILAVVSRAHCSGSLLNGRSGMRKG